MSRRTNLKQWIDRCLNSLFVPYEEELDVDMPCYWLSKIYEIKVESTISLSGSDIDHIMELALKGGITYWCKRVELATAWSDRPAYEHISRYGTLRFYDMDDRTHDLTLEKFLDGFRQFYIKSGKIRKDATGRINIRSIGRVEADTIIQYALYGEFYHE